MANFQPILRPIPFFFLPSPPLGSQSHSCYRHTEKKRERKKKRSEWMDGWPDRNLLLSSFLSPLSSFLLSSCGFDSNPSFALSTLPSGSSEQTFPIRIPFLESKREKYRGGFFVRKLAGNGHRYKSFYGTFLGSF